MRPKPLPFLAEEMKRGTEWFSQGHTCRGRAGAAGWGALGARRRVGTPGSSREAGEGEAGVLDV